MSVRLTSQENRVALFDSTSGIAFGPTFENEEEADAFLSFVAEQDERGPREIPQWSLKVLFDRFQLRNALK